MGDWPDPAQGVPTHINTTMTNYFPWASARWSGTALSANPASAAWPAEKLGLYIPFRLPHPFRVARFFWGNGSAAGGEWRMAVLTPGFERITQPFTTEAGTGNSVIQYATPAPVVLLPPGSYILGIVHDLTTANHALGLTITALVGRLAGMTQQSLGFVEIPAKAEPATFATTLYPLCGICSTASGF